MKKSIRAIKKKYKAEQMLRCMDVARECMPQFLAISKYYRDIIGTLELQTDTPPTYGGPGIHTDFLFDEMFVKLNKHFGKRLNTPFVVRSKREWASQIETEVEINLHGSAFDRYKAMRNL